MKKGLSIFGIVKFHNEWQTFLEQLILEKSSEGGRAFRIT